MSDFDGLEWPTPTFESAREMGSEFATDINSFLEDRIARFLLVVAELGGVDALESARAATVSLLRTWADALESSDHAPDTTTEEP